ncbi:MAG: D-glycero-D-manno-heptose 1,7-bisphosphate phosphatase [Flavobacterium sp.]|jgi:D-glycero-D-manno-heptose 1,7-bisphosphate phosphatase
MGIIILDRDGVINYDSVDYIKSTGEWQALPGSIEAIALLSKAGHKIYIASNQAGLARGLFNLNTLNLMHEKLSDLVDEAGGVIDGIFYCPHHPNDNCECRKPKIGLLEQISLHSGKSLIGVPFVGDSEKDIEAAIDMGCQPILVETGNGKITKANIDEKVPCFIDLLTFAQHFLNVC